MSRVFITGATGFIGSNLTRLCLDKGYRVSVLLRPGSSREQRLPQQDIEIVRADIRDEAALKKALKNTDIVFHCAALVSDWAPRRLFREINIDGTRSLCRAAQKSGCGRIVHLSTNDVFGLLKHKTITEEFPLRYWNEPYPDTKIDAEKICRRFMNTYQIPITTIYPCWVYGPGDQSFLPAIISSLKNRQMVFWRKAMIFYPTYIENLLDLLLAAAEDECAAGKGFLVHDGGPRTIQDLCCRIADYFGFSQPSLRIPYFAALCTARMMQTAARLRKNKTRPLLTTYLVKNWGSNLHFSIEQAAALLGWSPPLSFEEGLKQTLTHIKAHL